MTTSSSIPEDTGNPRALVVLCGTVATAVVVLLALLVTHAWAPLVDSDIRIDSAIHDWALRTPQAVDVALWLQDLGGTWWSTWFAVGTVLLLLVLRRWWLALSVALVAALAPYLTDTLKPIVGRSRPTWVVPIETLHDPSFPSGHATGGIAVWMVCGLAIGSLLRDPSLGALVALPFVVLGFAIGLSRLVLGVHWPSDVVAGWMVALAVTCLAGALFLARSRRPVVP